MAANIFKFVDFDIVDERYQRAQDIYAKANKEYYAITCRWETFRKNIHRPLTETEEYKERDEICNAIADVKKSEDILDEAIDEKYPSGKYPSGTDKASGTDKVFEKDRSCNIIIFINKNKC